MTDITPDSKPIQSADELVNKFKLKEGVIAEYTK